MKILAVDDDPVFLAILVPMLNALGKNDVTIAMSARDALAEMHGAAQKFDCLLFDIQMPGMNGVDLCQAVRTLPAYQRTPIVMITAMSGKRYIDAAFSAGATDYVTKPLDRVDLKARLGMVERLLQERCLAAALERQVALQGDGVTLAVDFETALPIPGFERGEFRAFEVAGDSMAPTINHRDVVVASRVEELRLLEPGEVYVVVTAESVMLKRINDRVRTNDLEVTLYSDNHHRKPYGMETADILELWRVVGYANTNHNESGAP